MKHLHGLDVLVLGLGDSGLAMARWCARAGAAVRVWDSREEPPQAAALRQHVPHARLFSGPLVEAAIDGVQLVLKSPGLAPGDERIATAIARAADRGALVQGELELFARALADLKVERGYDPKVIAITGTNGKTTTTAMTGLLVERAGRRVAVAGNIGPTMLQTLADALALEPVVQLVGAGAGADAAAEAAVPHPDPVAPASAPLRRDEPAPQPSAVPHAGEGAGLAAAPELADARLPASASGSAMEGEGPAGGTDTDDSEALLLSPVGGSGSEGAASPVAPDDEAPLELIAPPPAAPVFEHLPDVWVLELSSFQLDEAKGFEPTAAAVLNVTEDHLDWHGSLAAYAAAKQRIYGKTATMVVNRDDPLVEQMAANLTAPPPAPLGKSGKPLKAQKPIARRIVRFGLDAPRRPGDFGLITENGMAWLVRALAADETAPRGKRGAAAAEEELHIQRLMPADALRIRGRHNAANALAALALTTAIGCPLAPMLHGLREYRGEPHRVEHVATVGGIDAVDDSKGTNVGATVAALKGLGEDRAPAKLVVILGGDGKGQDFSPLAEPLRRHARAAATIGRDAPAIEAVLRQAGVPHERHDTLESATCWCFTQAQAGDTVLLSPACASLDMFRNYAHRAQVFVDAVHGLAADHGVTA